ncbi:MAG: hypothetical protein HKM94_03785, partial [Halobacteria archaeon]|nr:hypothetical protein [Halobacteria archaeon]
MGDHAKETVLAEHAIKLLENESISIVARLFLYFMIAEYEMLMGSVQKALDTIHNAMELSKKTGAYMLDALLNAHAVYALGTSGNPSGALPHLEKLKELTLPSRLLDVTHLNAHSGWIASALGDIDNGYAHAEKAVQQAEQTHAPLPLAFCKMSFAQLLEKKGKSKDALKTLQEAQAFVQKMNSTYVITTCDLIHAWFMFNQGKTKEGCKLLKVALEKARQHNFKAYMFLSFDVLTAMLYKALEYRIEVEFVQQLIRHYKLTPDESTRNLDNWPWHVRITTLGGFQIALDDQILDAELKNQKKPLELLKALIAFGVTDVSEDKLCEALWPDAEG